MWPGTSIGSSIEYVKEIRRYGRSALLGHSARVPAQVIESLIAVCIMKPGLHGHVQPGAT